jgi:hypothetical protein
VGLKHGQWIDTLLMQRPLGVGNADAARPTPAPPPAATGTARRSHHAQVVVSARHVVGAACHAFHAQDFDALQANRPARTSGTA